MKLFKKFLATFLSIALCFNTFIISVHATSLSSTSINKNTCEFIEFDDTIYSFEYSTISNIRIITITNLNTTNVDVITYKLNDSNIYLNNSVLATVSSMPSTLSYTSFSKSFGWQNTSSSSHYISWKQGTTALLVATAISAFLGTTGTAGVIASMGTAALGALASSCSGGTLYVNLQEYYVPLATPQYRFEWSFRASTGDYYGPYYYHVFF